MAGLLKGKVNDFEANWSISNARGDCEAVKNLISSRDGS